MDLANLLVELIVFVLDRIFFLAKFATDSLKAANAKDDAAAGESFVDRLTALGKAFVESGSELEVRVVAHPTDRGDIVEVAEVRAPSP